MSIIIAKEIDGVILIFSDCKVSIITEDKSVVGNNKLRLSPLDNILKTYILYDGVCISYAGDVEMANKIINEFRNERFHSIESILSFLKDKINDYGADVEFILCLAAGNNERYIYRINSSKVESGKSLWIGDKTAFSKFQEIYSEELNEARDELKAFQSSFRKLINEQTTPSIGDFIVETVFSNFPCFFYAERLDSVRGHEIINIKAHEEKILDEGSVDIGSYQISTLRSLHCNRPAVAHYFVHGEFGVFYSPELCLSNVGKGELIKGTTSEFKKKVKTKYNVELYGFNFQNGEITIG